MKFIITFLFLSLCILTAGLAQKIVTNTLIDTVLAKKITISGFCLCKTSLTELNKLDNELQEVDVDEMDLCKDGFVEDARFVNRKGYVSKKYPGLIFQKNNNDDLISKIRLTRDFVGVLPDGTSIDMKTLTVRDVLKHYPNFNTWRSRGCSDYWNLTNDTLSFFVKIDKNKKPQYPVDEAYYSTRRIEGIDLVLSCYDLFEKINNRYKQLFNDPVFFIDSVNVTRIELQQYQPTEIAALTVYKDSNAIRLVGEQGKYGAVYIETKKFARNKYWNYFKNKSLEYSKIVPTPESDSSIVYVLNGNVQTKNFEGDLLGINDSNLIELTIINREELNREFGITNKAYGIVIKAKIKKRSLNSK